MNIFLIERDLQLIFYMKKKNSNKSSLRRWIRTGIFEGEFFVQVFRREDALFRFAIGKNVY